MALITVGTVSELVLKSREGTATNPDNVSIRLADGTGTVYLEQHGHASTTTSYFIKDADTFSITMVAGDYLEAVVASGTEDIRVSGPQTALYGS